MLRVMTRLASMLLTASLVAACGAPEPLPTPPGGGPSPIVEPSPTPSPNPTATATPVSKLYQVTDVVDGDTFKINLDGKTESLRLIGIDTPETVDPRTPVQCFGREASLRAKELLNGKRVRVEQDPTQDTRDKYGRLLMYAWLEDGTFYNLAMVKDGYGREYTFDRPYRYQAEFRAAEQAARSVFTGLWSPLTCGGTTAWAADPPPTPTATRTPPSPTVAPAAPATTATRPPAPPPTTQTLAPTVRENCDPAYPGVCIPPLPPDLDCPDIRRMGYRAIRVLPPDPHRLDRDGDGVGCE